MKKLLIIASLLLVSLAGSAQDKQPVYKSSFFGIRSNGTTDNTTSIQKAVDFIASKGGGTLEFSVGRYLTGAVQLKSGVDIYLREGAVIVGSSNIYSYGGHKGVFWGEGISDVTISGKGVIDGRGPELLRNIDGQIKMRHIDEPVIPTLVYLKDCQNVSLKNFILRYPATKEDLYIIEGGSVTVEGCYTDTK
jgi:polygalacturonase